MSFKAVWGFNPEEVLKAQQIFVQLAACVPDEEDPAADDATERVAMPSDRGSQISELRRMFRL